MALPRQRDRELRPLAVADHDHALARDRRAGQIVDEREDGWAIRRRTPLQRRRPGAGGEHDRVAPGRGQQVSGGACAHPEVHAGRRQLAQQVLHVVGHVAEVQGGHLRRAPQ